MSKIPFFLFLLFPLFLLLLLLIFFFFNFSSPSIHHRTPSGLSIRIAPARATSHPSPTPRRTSPCRRFPRRLRPPPPIAPGFPRVAIEIPLASLASPSNSLAAMEADRAELTGRPWRQLARSSSAGRLPHLPAACEVKMFWHTLWHSFAQNSFLSCWRSCAKRTLTGMWNLLRQVTFCLWRPRG
jgi:hypothetical protein